MKFISCAYKFTVVVLLLAVVVFIYSYYIEPNLLIHNKFQIQAPMKVSKCRIVFFSDTHLGRFYKQENIERVVNEINSQSPDIVILGGDFMDNYSKDKEILNIDYIQSHLSRINSTYGKFAVFGNHDYGGGSTNIYKKLMSNSGFTVLKNEGFSIEEAGINIFGYDDMLIGKTPAELYNIDNNYYNVIVSHEPDVAMSINAKTPSLMFSGHSHGGQVMLPFITKKILPNGARTYIRGLYEGVGKNKNITLFVSKGIGMTSLPLRLFAVPEIIVADIRT